MNRFSIREAMLYALNIFGKNFIGIFFLGMLSVVFISVAQMAVDWFVISNFGLVHSNELAKTMPVLAFFRPLIGVFIYSAIVFLLHSMVFFFLTSAFLPLFWGYELKLRNFFPSFKKIVRFLMGLFIIIVPFGIALLVFFLVTSAPVTNFFVENGLLSVLILVPVLILAAGITITIMLLRYMFFYFEILENADVSTAFRKSAEMTIGRRKKLVLLLIILIFINFIGRMLIMGTIITLPFFVLVLIYVYFKVDRKRLPEEIKSDVLNSELAAHQNGENI